MNSNWYRWSRKTPSSAASPLQWKWVICLSPSFSLCLDNLHSPKDQWTYWEKMAFCRASPKMNYWMRNELAQNSRGIYFLKGRWLFNLYLSSTVNMDAQNRTKRSEKTSRISPNSKGIDRNEIIYPLASKSRSSGNSVSIQFAKAIHQAIVRAFCVLPDTGRKNWYTTHPLLSNARVAASINDSTKTKRMDSPVDWGERQI